MSRILSWLGQLVFLVVVTFLFIVLYAHGTSDFARNAQTELNQLISWVKGDGGGGDVANFPPSK